MATELKCFDVYDNGEYATVFLQYGERLNQNGHTQHFGTICVYSSFGTYGHYWSHMGKPMPAFLCGIDTDYLLSKISSREADADELIWSVRRHILEVRREESITAEQARDAWHAVREIEDEGGHPAVIEHLLYNCSDLEPLDVGCAFEGATKFPLDARRFAEAIWPLIVAHLQEPAAVV